MIILNRTILIGRFGYILYLYLFRSPRHFLAHCWWWLDGRNILQRDIAKAYEADETADEFSEEPALENERPDEDVDWDIVLAIVSCACRDLF